MPYIYRAYGIWHLPEHITDSQSQLLGGSAPPGCANCSSNHRSIESAGGVSNPKTWRAFCLKNGVETWEFVVSVVADLARFIKPPNPGESPIFRSSGLYHLWRIVSEDV